MNFWDNLPYEVQNEILGYIATTIQKIWRSKSVRPSKLALKFMNELLIEIKPDDEMYNNTLSNEEIDWKLIDTMSPRTALIVRYCSKYANYVIGGEIWNSFMITINHDMWLNEYTGGPGVIYYNHIELDLQILQDRLVCGG